MANDDLRAANKAKKDEFYTSYEDIQTEMNNYDQLFRGKTVLCNCDDPFESNFCKFFLRNFNYLGLKRLICTSYTSSPIIGAQLTLWDNMNELVQKGYGYVMDISEVPMANGRGVSDDDINDLLHSEKRGVKKLHGDGDFRSEECIEYLKQADIVVTNPPFSLFREFVAILTKYKKDFLIIGNTNALTYREIFKLFKEDRIRTGYTKFNVGMFFEVPDYYEKYTKKVDGKKYARVSTSCWFTSLPVKKHNDVLICYKQYDPDRYPKYANFDAINVNKYTDIPNDYDGLMGVPVTFLDKYNPEQFELVGLGISNSGLEIGVRPYTPEHKKYRKEIQHKGAVDGDLYLIDNEGHPDVPYARIIIRRKEN